MSNPAANSIIVRGACTHNLQRIDVDIPRNQLVVMTGVSGSGKSSLAFDTLYAEGQWRYLDCLSQRTRQLLDVVARPPVDRLDGLPPTMCLEQRPAAVSRRSTVATITEIHDYLRILYAHAGTPHCPHCGVAIVQRSAQAIVDQILSLEAGRKVMLLAPLVRGKKGSHVDVLARVAKEGFVRARINGELVDLSEPPQLAKSKIHHIDAIVDRIVIKAGLRDRLDESVNLALRIGSGACIVSEQAGEGWVDHLYSSRFVCPQCNISFAELEPRTFSFNSPYGACPDCQGMGVIGDPPDQSECATCGGTRLQPFGRSVAFQGTTLPQLTALTVEDSLARLKDWETMVAADQSPEAQVAQRVLGAIRQRVDYLQQVGLGYLSLDRSATTLSGGELQRTRLAGCLGAGLIGVCYVLDEPTVGLHTRDTERLLSMLQTLRNQGASVIVVEHDLDIIRRADFILDLGPGAGRAGGRLLAAGPLAEIENNPSSLTGDYLAGRRTIERSLSGVGQSPVRGPSLTLRGVSIHNLQSVTLDLPMGGLTCVTGVSGSGKTSLIMEALVPVLKSKLLDRLAPPAACGVLDGVLDGESAISRLVEVDQSPIGSSGRSNPATYSGLWDEIRKLFARTREARARGFKASRFSFNASGGRCPACHGHGTYRTQAALMGELPAVCPVCLGKRFNPATLAIRFRGLSVADVLDLSIADAAEFFQNLAPIARPLQMFVEVGLGHLTLGQPANTLSGGESQRVKLATELAGEHQSQTLFVLDEPTTGLHLHDIARLMVILRRLTADGHTVVLIEHQLDVIAAADWIIDLGPDGGAGGGRIIAEGTPSDVAQSGNGPTAVALLQHLSRRH